MEKKEIQKWRDRLIKMFGIYHSDGQEYVTCPLCGINLDELAKHMIEELDKAREEGRLSVIQELLFEPEEPSHNIGTLEAAFKYEDIIKRYSGEWRNKTGLVSPKYIKSKLKDNK